MHYFLGLKQPQKMKINILIVLLLLVSATAISQPLDRDICRTMAMENNKKLAIAAAEKQQSQFDVKVYRAKYFPKISATGNYLASNSTIGLTLAGGLLPIIGANGVPIPGQAAFMPDIQMDAQFNNSYLVGVALAQPIYMGGKIRAANSVAKLLDEIAQENIRKTTDEVIVESDKAYWQYIRVCEMELVALKYQYVIEELIRNVKNSVELGMISNSNLLKAQAKLNEAKLMVRKAENGERLAKMNLCYVIGLELDSELEIKDLVNSEILKPDFIGDDINLRAEVEMLSKQEQIYGEQVRIARSDFLPSVGVTGGYSYMGGLKVNNDLLSTNGSFSALFSVSIPIFSWGEGRNRVRSAKAKQEVARLKKEEYKQLMRLEANKSFNEFEEAYYRVELTNNSLIFAAENMKNSKDNYEIGMESLVDYLEAQTLWQQSWSDYIDAKAMFQLGQTYYLKSIGRLDTGI